MIERSVRHYLSLWLGALIALAADAQGLEIPTSEGNGADTYLSNDPNSGPTAVHGAESVMNLRFATAPRLRLLYLRFDISGVQGDLSGATITLNGTDVNRTRPIDFYGVVDGATGGQGEDWTEGGAGGVSFSTAAGIDPGSADGTYALTADATAGVVAQVPNPPGSGDGLNTTAPSTGLDAFLAADTDGLVTFIVTLETLRNYSESFFFSTKEGGVAPVLTLPNASAAPAGDIDADGLDDWWEDAHFGDANGTATLGELALHDGTGDPDGDGFDNEAEESASTDPTDPVAYPGADVYYVAPDGDDAHPGTIDAPFATLGRAQAEVTAGSTVYLRGGTHVIEVSEVGEYASIFARVFLLGKSGSEGSPIRYWAYPGEEPVFDLSAVNPAGYRIYTFHVTGDWLHFRGLTVTGVQVNILTHTQSICFDNQGSHNIYERLVMRDNQAIGMWIGNGSNNLVLNCDAYRNWDFTSEGGVGGNVDGFGCHASADEGNVFRGCRAWLNSDDGFDLINQKQPVVIEHCWAAYNGYDYNFVSRSDGNGFKAGGFAGTPAGSLPDPVPRHVVRDCLAVGNKQSGFYANHHPGGLTFVGNTALRNKRNFNMLNRLVSDNVTDVDGYDHILRNNVGVDATLTELANVDLAACDSSHNYWELPVTVDAEDFQSVDESLLTAPRQANGELPVVPLMRLASGSDLIDAGIAAGDPFAGDSPDLGCFEEGLIELALGGFERPVVSVPALRPDGAVWTFSGSARILPDPATGDGSQACGLGAGGVVAQECAGFVPGRVYRVHVEAAAPVPGVLEFRVDGVVLVTHPVNSGAYGAFDAMFTAGAAQHAIGFAVPGASADLRVDAVTVSELTEETDSDLDGLPDLWELSWFGTLAETAVGDPDGDGSENGVEELLGLDPTSGREFFHCGITTARELTWPGASGIDFTVQRSVNLATWVDIAVVSGNDGPTFHTDPEAPIGGAFYRVAFDQP